MCLGKIQFQSDICIKKKKIYFSKINYCLTEVRYFKNKDMQSKNRIVLFIMNRHCHRNKTLHYEIKK